MSRSHSKTHQPAVGLKRRTNRPKVLIPCCFGFVYSKKRNGLRIVVDTADAIVDRLLEIDDVVLDKRYGPWCYLTCPELRLPDVTRVMVPLDSVRAPATLGIAAHGGQIR